MLGRIHAGRLPLDSKGSEGDQSMVRLVDATERLDYFRVRQAVLEASWQYYSCSSRRALYSMLE